MKPSARVAGSRRVGFHHQIHTFQQASPTTTSGELPLPLEAATIVSATYIETLHSGPMKTFLTKFTTAALSAYNEYYKHKCKNKEMHLDPTHIPTSIKNTKFVLQPLEEVQESEGYKALQSKHELITKEYQRKLADEIAKPLNDMTAEARLKRFHLASCVLLRSAAELFIAQLDIRSYDADMAIIDLLSTSPMDILRSPLPTDLADFLSLYKEANKESIVHLPLPSNKSTNGMENIIDDINNNRPMMRNTHALQAETTAASAAVSRITTDDQSPLSSITGTLQSDEEAIRAETSTEGSMQPPPQSTRAGFITPLHPPPPITPTGISGTHFRTARSILANNSDTAAIDNSQDLRGFSYTMDDEIQRTPQDPYEPSYNGHDIEYLQSQELNEVDMQSINATAQRLTLLKMIRTLFTQTITMPITEFHAMVTRREELVRIKRITAAATKSCLTAKVAAKISSERPADCPVLSGLIREETEKISTSLSRRLTSAMDQLEHVKKQQQLMLQQYGNRQVGYNSSIRQGSKNYRGSNNKNKVWQRNQVTGDSSVAAATLPTNSTTSTQPPLPRSQHQGTKRKHQPRTQHNQNGNSVETGDNASSARRRRGNNKKQNSNRRENVMN